MGNDIKIALLLLAIIYIAYLCNAIAKHGFN